MSILSKTPKLEDIAAVYAVIVTMIYPWTLSRYFWKLPSWMLFASVEDLAGFFAYMVAVNLMESLLVLAVPLGLSLILPRSWFHERFRTRGASLALFGLGFLIYLNRKMHIDSPFPVVLMMWIPAVVAGIIALVYLVDRVGFLRRALDEAASRLTIFLYITIPISTISLLVVLIRNVS